MDTKAQKKKAGRKKEQAGKIEPAETKASGGGESSQPAPPSDLAPAAPAPGGTSIAGPASDIEMLAFRLGNEQYAIEIEQVREVIKVWEITPVPNTAEHIIGITSLRGSVLPVINLSSRLGLVDPVKDEKSRIIIAGLDDDETGFIVDRVTGVVRFLPEDIRPVPDTIEHGAGAEFLRGIVRQHEKLYILLDIEKVLGA